MRQIIEIRREMNDGGKRKFSEEEILARIQESSETIRQTSEQETLDDDIVRSSEKSEVNTHERS